MQWRTSCMAGTTWSNYPVSFLNVSLSQNCLLVEKFLNKNTQSSIKIPISGEFKISAPT